jgi:DNA modification methylase
MDVMLTPEKDIRLHCKDCIDLTQSLRSDLVDMVITSPPYDELRHYGKHPFDWRALAVELFRITKPGGVVIWVVGDSTIKGSESGTSFRQALFFNELGFKINDTMIYAKKNPMPTPGKRYHQAFEYMFCFSKGIPKTFNPIQVESKYHGVAFMKDRGKEGTLNYTKKLRTAKHKVTNVFSYAIGGGISTKDEIAYGHPAIFPESLVQDQLMTWSNPNDLVCDPLFGSGTTAKLCMLMERQFIGSEIEPTYYKLACRRLAETRAYLSSPKVTEKIL